VPLVPGPAKTGAVAITLSVFSSLTVIFKNSLTSYF